MGGITKLKRNAFTLIELLAIIVILAIIAVITVPIILNIIENSRKGAASDSAYGYKDAVNKYYVTELSKSENQNLILSGQYDVSNGGVLNGSGISNKEIPISGDKPSGGYLNYSNNTLTGGCLVFGDYEVTFGSNGSVSETKKGDCLTRYTVTFNSNEGSTVSSQTIVAGGTIATPADPEKDGYTFDGWYVDSGLTTQFTSSTQITENTTLYAKWKVAEHWDKYHQYIREFDDYGEYDSIDSSWIVWIQENTSNNIFEGCAKVGNSTFCLNPSLWDCTYDNATDNPGCTANGYVLGKKSELEQGGFVCELDSYLKCYYPNSSNNQIQLEFKDDEVRWDEFISDTEEVSFGTYCTVTSDGGSCN